MSITKADFNKIWGNTSSVPIYAFTDADYQDGWEFVGNLPPTRAMWDTLQRRNDQKMKYLMDNGTMWVDSVSDLRSYDASVGEVVATKGYYTPNDGGNSFFVVRADSSDTDDGGSIIILDNGNVAELITDGTVTPEQFGAKGDGVTDDADAVQNAINFGETINLTKKYLLGTQLVITKSVHLIGAKNTRKVSADSTFVITDDFSDGAIIRLDTSVDGYLTGVYIENLNITGNYTDGDASGVTGIYVPDSCYHLTFRNVQIAYCHYGWNMGRAWNILFDMCVADHTEIGWRTTGTVTSTTFTSCLGYNSVAGFRFDGGTNYTSLISCGSDHCDRGVYHNGSGLVVLVNFGCEDYVKAVRADTNAFLALYGGFFYPSDRSQRVLEAVGKIVCYNIKFPESSAMITTDASSVTFNDCINNPTGGNCTVAGIPVPDILAEQQNKYTRYRGVLIDIAPNTTFVFTMTNASDARSIIHLTFYSGLVGVVDYHAVLSNGNYQYVGSDPNIFTASYDSGTKALTITLVAYSIVNVDCLLRSTSFVRT